MSLREMENNVEIAGLVKSMNLKEGVTKKGRADIQGNVTIEVVDGKKINNIQVNVFAFKEKKDGSLSKLFTGLQTVMNEYHTIDDDGRENADFVTVTGNLDANIYFSNSTVHSFNRIRGVFFNRGERTDKQHALAKIEMIITNIAPAADANGDSLGYSNVTAYSCGYNHSVIPMFNLQIPDGDMAQQFSEIYPENTTGKITVKINNYAQEEEKPSASEKLGFGQDVELASEKSKDYVNNLEIVGGTMPNYDKQFEQEDIQELVKQYHELVNEAKESSSDGFDSGFGKSSAPLDDKTKAATDNALSDMFGDEKGPKGGEGDINPSDFGSF